MKSTVNTYFSKETYSFVQRVDELNDVVSGRSGRNMAIVISTVNMKGGVGKTTTLVGLAEMLVKEFKKKILMIDLDPQSNATLMLLGEERWQDLSRQGSTLATLFEDAIDGDEKKFSLEKTLQHNVSNIIGMKNLSLLPSSRDLLSIQDILAKIPTGPFHENNPIEILKRAILPIKFNYDYILIDCPSNLGIVTLNGLRISNGYVIPTIPDYLSTYGISYIANRVEEFAENMDIQIENLGLIVTKFEENSTMHRAILEKIRQHRKVNTFRTIFKKNDRTAMAADYEIQYKSVKEKWGENSSAFYHLAKEIIRKFEV